MGGLAARLLLSSEYRTRSDRGFPQDMIVPVRTVSPIMGRSRWKKYSPIQGHKKLVVLQARGYTEVHVKAPTCSVFDRGTG